MGTVIPGKLISQQIESEISEIVRTLPTPPRLAVVLASSDESSYTYVRMKKKKAESLGIEVKIYEFDGATSKDLLIKEIRRFRQNEAVHGVLIQVPFFSNLQPYTNEIINSLTYVKDADGLTAIQQGLSSHLLEGSIPTAAVEAVLESLAFAIGPELKYAEIVGTKTPTTKLEGKNILIVNNTNLIGKPLSSILTSLNATVTIANRFTKNLFEMSKMADIVISGTNQGSLFTSHHIKENAIIIDLTSKKESNNSDSKIIGDFVLDQEMVSKVSFYTPVPGGIGPITIACLLRNVVQLTKNNFS